MIAIIRYSLVYLNNIILRLRWNEDGIKYLEFLIFDQLN